MRIGMMADIYKPHISGVTNYISQYKTHFEAQGHEIYVFTFGADLEEPGEEKVIRSPGFPFTLRYGDKDYPVNLRYSKKARRLLQSMDLVHVHHPFLSGPLALRYCRPAGVPVVFTNHTRYDLYAQAFFPQIPGGVGRAFLEAYLPPFCKACDLVIAPSEGLREVLSGFGVLSPIHVVPNGVDITPFRCTDPVLSKTDIGIAEDRVLLIYSGRLGAEKNLPFLLRAFAGAVQAFPTLHLLIVGEGIERDNLEDRVRHMNISEHVTFAGFIPYERIPDYLCTADIFVTSSVSEVHPLSVIEAMAAGLPVLGIQSPGVGDIVKDGETGFLATNDLASFTAKLVRLVVDVDLRAAMREKAGVAAEDYTIARTGTMILELYENLVHQAAS